MVVLIAMQAVAAGTYLRRVRPRLYQLRRLTNAFTILQQGLELMEKQELDGETFRASATITETIATSAKRPKLANIYFFIQNPSVLQRCNGIFAHRASQPKYWASPTYH